MASAPSSVTLVSTTVRGYRSVEGSSQSGVVGVDQARLAGVFHPRSDGLRDVHHPPGKLGVWLLDLDLALLLHLRHHAATSPAARIGLGRQTSRSACQRSSQPCARQSSDGPLRTCAPPSCLAWATTGRPESARCIRAFSAARRAQSAGGAVAVGHETGHRAAYPHAHLVTKPTAPYAGDTVHHNRLRRPLHVSSTSIMNASDCAAAASFAAPAELRPAWGTPAAPPPGAVRMSMAGCRCRQRCRAVR